MCVKGVYAYLNWLEAFLTLLNLNKISSGINTFKLKSLYAYCMGENPAARRGWARCGVNEHKMGLSSDSELQETSAQCRAVEPSNGSWVIPRRARPGLAGLRPRTFDRWVLPPFGKQVLPSFDICTYLYICVNMNIYIYIYICICI